MTAVNTRSWLTEVSFNNDGLIPAIAKDKDTGRVLMMAWMNAESLTLTVKERVAVYYSRSRKKLWRKGETSGHTQVVHSIKLDCDADAIVLIITQVSGIACHTGRESCFYKELSLDDDNPTWQSIDPILKDPNVIYGNTVNLSSSQSTISQNLNSADTKNVSVSSTQNNVNPTTDILSQLDHILTERKQADANSSYVASLYSKGLNKILEKVGEESVETIISAKEYQNFIEINKPVVESSLSSKDHEQKSALKDDLIYEVADLWFHTLVTLSWFNIESASVLNELARRFGLSGIDEKKARDTSKN